MTLLYLESFQLFDATLAAGRGWTLNGAQIVNNAANPRFDPYLLLCSGDAVWRGLETPVNELIIGFAFWYSGTLPAQTTILQILEGDIVHLELRLDNGVLAAYTGSLWLASGTTVLASDTWYYIEVRSRISDLFGLCFAYLNGVQEINVGADIQQGGNGVIDGYRFVQAGSATTQYDDIYVLDRNGSVNNAPLGPTRVMCLMPVGDGGYQDWQTITPNVEHWTEVDEYPPDGDLTYVYTNKLGDSAGFYFATLPETPDEIFGVQLSLCAIQFDVGPQRNLKGFLLTGGGGETEGAAHPLTHQYTYVRDVFEDNDGNPWTPQYLAVAEFGGRLA